MYWYAPWVFFEVVSVLSCSPFMFENTENIQLIDGEWCTQSVLAVISPLRQWLYSYAKTHLKMFHTLKHFIHMQYISLLTNLVIVFVRWVSTGVLYEPRQCSLFWDYIPESKLCFCVNLCRPSGPYLVRLIKKLLNCQTTTRGGCCSIHPDGEQLKTALLLWVREMTYLHTRGVRGRM